jgi:inorganic pyrophosphatase
MATVDSSEYLGKEISVVVDHQLGSKHPVLDGIYEVNVGYVPDSVAQDGDEIEAYVLGVSKPIDGFKGQCVAVLRGSGNGVDKLIVCPSHMSYSGDEIRVLTAFQEKDTEFEIIQSGKQ